MLSPPITRMKPLISIVAAALALSAVSCQGLIQSSATQTASTSSTQATKLHFPGPWLEHPESPDWIQQIEVRKIADSSDGEFFFAALPDGVFDYAYEVDNKLPKPRYGKHKFAVSFSSGLQVRTATDQEWESGSRIATTSRLLSPKTNDESSGELEYRRKSYSKTGKYWGAALLSPTGKWLAIFSCSGLKRPPDILFGGGDIPVGDMFWEVYDTSTGTKVFQWEAKNVRNPMRFDDPVVWLDERYFLFPVDEESRTYNVVTLPPVTPEVNPVTLQVPPRKDAAGQPLPPGDRDEVWIPLIPLTKEQAEKLTARAETEISEARWTRDELLVAINEETENRRVNRLQRDGTGDYHLRVIDTYYYAISLDNPTRTRVVTKEEFKRAQTRRSGRPKTEPGPAGDTVAGPFPPHRQFPKSGTTWGSPAVLIAGEWIAVFSYNENRQQAAAGEIFVDVYDQRMGYKLMTTALPFATSPNELLKHATWIEGGYILLPLNASFDSFALWQLPGGY